MTEDAGTNPRSPRDPQPVLEIRNVRMHYQALRPLRVADLTVAEAERVALSGLDAGAAELLVNLVTGAALPEEGEIRVFGRSTAAITTGDDWIASLDRFGIVSERAVLLEGATLEQNLAMPFTLAIDPIPPEISGRVAALAQACGIPAAALAQPCAELAPPIRMRAHLARAIALEPALLLVEHPTAQIDEHDRPALAADLVRVTEARRLAVVIMTNDEAFARAVAPRSLRLNAATGDLVPLKRGWFR
jgi:ABC-type transporter Mla maintaining outer membrane lipid asymmetry ATPase subunit MlaF